MSDQTKPLPIDPQPQVERLTALSEADLNDLCDATDAAITSGGGFGWTSLPARDILERYWQGVITMPGRILLVARLDGVICGTCQLLLPPKQNQAQAHIVQITTTFVTPWARGHKLGTKLMMLAEQEALSEGFSVINLDVRETADQAIRLYEKLGYVRTGTHPYYAKIDDQILKGYHYYKLINPKAVEQQA